MLAKLGRVLREKAAGDYERFFKGTSKTRERLGVRSAAPGCWGGVAGGGSASRWFCSSKALSCLDIFWENRHVRGDIGLLSLFVCAGEKALTLFHFRQDDSSCSMPLWPRVMQLVEELLTFWSLEDYESTLEELEEALIVRPPPAVAAAVSAICASAS